MLTSIFPQKSFAKKLADGPIIIAGVIPIAWAGAWALPVTFVMGHVLEPLLHQGNRATSMAIMVAPSKYARLVALPGGWEVLPVVFHRIMVMEILPATHRNV